MFHIMNPHGVPFLVKADSQSVKIYDTRYMFDSESPGVLAASMHHSTLYTKVQQGGEIWFSNWEPNALSDWMLSAENAREVMAWVESQRDPNEIPTDLLMGDGTLAQVGQRVEFKRGGRFLQGTIVAILKPHDPGTPPPDVAKSRWKVSTEHYVLWHRAVVEVTDGNGRALYFGVAIARQSGSGLRLLDSVKTA